MQIVTGLFDHCVLQRTARNLSAARITGSTSGNGPVHAKVSRNNKTLPGFAHKKIGAAVRGKFTATLAGVPTGGPYTIELSTGADSLILRDVLVGDVWIAGGQSNMHGCGLLSEALPPHPLCRAFYMDDHWDVAHDPINDISNAVDEVHGIKSPPAAPTNVPPPKPVIGTGPAVAFIQEMQRITGVPQGVIASSHGGTSMAEWDPAKKSRGSKSFYGATLRRFEKNGGSVAGIIWYQGESETMTPEATPVYPQKMKQLVKAFRKDLRSPRLPIATVQISRIVGWAEFPGWNIVQEMQRQFPRTIANLATVPTIDLTLDDGIHIAGKCQHRLGKRLAHAMLDLLHHPKALPPPITLRSIAVETVARRNVATLVVTFDNVVGKLRAGGRPNGFVMLDDKNLNYIFDVTLEKNRAILRTDRAPGDIAGRRLYYGYGCDPLCNITDDADRSLPAFGPILLPTGKLHP